MKNRHYGRGWNLVVRNLQDDIARVAPDLPVKDIREDKFGGLLFIYDPTELNDRQIDFINRRISRANMVALETCVSCGFAGRLRYTQEPTLQARVFCDNHTPKDWNTLDAS